MTPSMPRPMTIIATITSISVKPCCAWMRECRGRRMRWSGRSVARIGNTLLALALFGRRLGLRNHGPVALVLALLDAQVAVGQRCHAPQGRRTIALDLQFEWHDIAARQHCELRRPLLAL